MEEVKERRDKNLNANYASHPCLHSIAALDQQSGPELQDVIVLLEANVIVWNCHVLAAEPYKKMISINLTFGVKKQIAIAKPGKKQGFEALGGI